ncbi:MAG: hypothetical protein S4CHLAM123_07260 [Chlamydiales bacterium]|nr:hypothetical protein [Chlamydiales bacterium]
MENLEHFKQRIERQAALYQKIKEAYQASPHSIVHLDEYFDEVIEAFGPALNQPQVDLKQIYSASFHPRTRSLITATRGATLLAKAEHSNKHYILRHVAAAVYQPAYGIELVNIGIVGNIYQGPLILRAESACPPSFLFHSQRCNCVYQWASIRELAAHLNEIDPPKLSKPALLERWIESQFQHKENKHLVSQEGPGVLMFHFDSQAGMGCGFTEGEFCYDLGMRATLRHLGENTVAQVCHTTIKEGYQALGLVADGREKGGYRLTPILLDWLECSKNLIYLSNNLQKIEALEQSGYTCKRIKSLGQVLEAGMLEASQRSGDFGHLDIGQHQISFEEEMERLKSSLI